MAHERTGFSLYALAGAGAGAPPENEIDALEMIPREGPRPRGPRGQRVNTIFANGRGVLRRGFLGGAPFCGN